MWFLKKLSSMLTSSSFAHNLHHKTDYTFIIIYNTSFTTVKMNQFLKKKKMVMASYTTPK